MGMPPQMPLPGRDHSVTTGIAPHTLRIWTYTRVSDDRGGISGSVGQQDDEITDDAAAAFPGSVVERRYSDPDRSASRFALSEKQRLIEGAEPNRPEWRAMERDLRVLQPPDVIAFWESSRSARQMGPWVRLLDLCRIHGILLRFVKDGRTYDPGNAADREHLLNEGIRAEGSSEDTSARVRRDKRAAARKGRPAGPRLYGYTKLRDYKGHLTGVIINEEEARVVREIFWRTARGEAQQRICDDLTARGILTPRASAASRELAQCDNPKRRAVLEKQIAAKWNHPAITGIVNSLAYIGERVHNGEVIAKAMWPPIVATVLAAQARAAIAQRARIGSRPGRYVYLLSFTGECGICHEPLHGLKPSRKGEQGTNYCCPGKARHAAVKTALLDEYVTEAVILRLCDPGLLRELGAGDGSAREIQALLASAAEKEQRLIEAADSHARNGRPSLAILTQLEDTLQPLIALDRKRAEDLASMPMLAGLTGPEPQVRAAWAALKLEQKRAVIRMLITKLELTPAGGKKNRPLSERVTIMFAGKPQEPGSEPASSAPPE